MAFGKKNKKKMKQEQPRQTAKKVKVDMRHNPLYPLKKESDAKELLTALGTTVISLILVGVIVINFSYANRASANGNKYASRQPSAQKQEEAYGGDVNGEGVNGENVNNGETYGEGVQDGQIDESVGSGEVLDDEKEAAAEDAFGESEENKDYIEETRDYIIDDSDSRYLYLEELEELSAEELFYARNEIYARCGRLFNDEGLQAYFDSKEWYHGTISPEDFTEEMLNDYERKNAVFIREYEIEHGYQ